MVICYRGPREPTQKLTLTLGCFGLSKNICRFEYEVKFTSCDVEVVHQSDGTGDTSNTSSCPVREGTEKDERDGVWQMERGRQNLLWWVAWA